MTRLDEGGQGVGDLQVKIHGITVLDVIEDHLSELGGRHRGFIHPGEFHWRTCFFVLLQHNVVSDYLGYIIDSILQSINNLATRC